MKTYTTSTSIFDQLLGDINYKDDTNLYPFKVRVGVVKYRPPRHEFFEIILNMGYTNIDPILYHKKFNPPPTLNFVFPERFMMDIITSNPMIIGNFKKEMIRVIQWPDDDKKYETINT